MFGLSRALLGHPLAARDPAGSRAEFCSAAARHHAAPARGETHAQDAGPAVVAPARQPPAIGLHRAGPKRAPQCPERHLDRPARAAPRSQRQRPTAAGLARARLAALLETRSGAPARPGQQHPPTAALAQRGHAGPVAVAGERVDIGRKQRQQRSRARQQRQLAPAAPGSVDRAAAAQQPRRGRSARPPPRSTIARRAPQVDPAPARQVEARACGAPGSTTGAASRSGPNMNSSSCARRARVARDRRARDGA